MKKLAYIIPVFTAFLFVILFSQCKKETDCKVRIICKYSETGIDTGKIVPGCTVKLGKEDFADYAKAEGKCDINGVYETAFQYQAILEINANYVIVDSLTEEVDEFTGRGEIKLMPGETVEKVVLLIRQ